MKASDIGKLGVWGFLDACDYKQCIELAQTVEQLGYSTLWVPEAFGRDPFVTITLLAGETEKLYLATGIANIYARDATATLQGQHTLSRLSGGRFLLGLGVSHAPLVEDARGHVYGKPVATSERRRSSETKMARGSRMQCTTRPSGNHSSSVST